MEDLEINNMVESKIKECQGKCDYGGKLDRDTFWKIFIPIITYLVLVGISIANLYILYYSGLTEIKVDVAVIKEKVINMQKTTGNTINLDDYNVEKVK